jgi:hypothetical protein
VRLLGPEDGKVRRISHRYRAPVIFLVEQADTNAVRRAMKIQATTSLVGTYDRSALALAQALKLTTGLRA